MIVGVGEPMILSNSSWLDGTCSDDLAIQSKAAMASNRVDHAVLALSFSLSLSCFGYAGLPLVLGPRAMRHAYG